MPTYLEKLYNATDALESLQSAEECVYQSDLDRQISKLLIELYDIIDDVE